MYLRGYVDYHLPLSEIWSGNRIMSEMLLHLQISKVASVWFPSCMMTARLVDFHTVFERMLQYSYNHSQLNHFWNTWSILVVLLGYIWWAELAYPSDHQSSSQLTLETLTMKYVNSSWFPSNVSVSTCGADCSCTNFDIIYETSFSCTDLCYLLLLVLLSSMYRTSQNWSFVLLQDG